jgi:hypothetical protein
MPFYKNVKGREQPKDIMLTPVAYLEARDPEHNIQELNLFSCFSEKVVGKAKHRHYAVFF